jgi:hypothetical protein
MSYGKSVHNRPERKFQPVTRDNGGASSVPQSVESPNTRAKLIAKRRESGDQMEQTLGGKS